MKKSTNKKSIRSAEMIILTYIFTGLFLLLMGYLVYFQLRISEDVINSPYNRRRQELLAEKVVRGNILAKNGEVIAKTVTNSDGTEERQYPYGRIFSHVAGYSAKGGSGLEAYNNIRLLRSNVFFGEHVLNNMQGIKNSGDNVVTTLDYTIQKAAYEALGSYEGAVVVMEPDTGKILALVSKPDYDPNDIEAIWDTITDKDSEESILFNRATQGQYPPGSTFKILTALEYMRENGNYGDYSYTCNGSYMEEGEGHVINCYHGTVHGKVDLTSSFAKSCNSSFVNIGLQLKRDELTALCESFQFNKDISIGIASNASKFTISDKTTTYKMMQTVIGQGDTLATPLQMAMVTATIANDGVMMTPYLVDHVESIKGSTIRSYRPKQLADPITSEEASAMKALMSEVVKSGTGTKLKGQSYNAAGKTGSAEYGSEKGKSHAWFVGFTDVEDHSIVISVLVERAGSGSDYAVPIAKKVLDAYYKGRD